MGATFKASDNYQLDNSVNYFSPAVGGFSVGLGYSFDVAGNHYAGQRSPHGSLALQYQNGPLLIVATWDKAWLANTMLALAHDPSAWQLGVSYDFGGLRTVAAWSRQSSGYVGLDGGDPDDLGVAWARAPLQRVGILTLISQASRFPQASVTKFCCSGLM